MPLFDFRCRTCARVFEALVRPQDAAGPICPGCGGRDLEKLLASFAVSSAERSRAAATTARKKAAATAARDNVALEHEVERHRREDH